MVAVGGMANIASQVNASATVLIQTFIIFFTDIYKLNIWRE